MVIKMTDRKKENLKIICRYLPCILSAALENLSDEAVHSLCEIRIRAEKPAVLIFTDRRRFITASGRLTEFSSNSLIILSQKETESVFNAMCSYSVHSMSDDIAEGFITLEGGSRVGIYGKAVTRRNSIIAVRNIRGMNIRVSGNFIGAAEPISELIGEKRANVLICGPPSSGKTTLLRDFCRILSDEKGLKVCLVDERCEADGCCTGINTDVLSGYPKAAGIQTAVRTLSPEVIAFDEIGTAEEAEAVINGLNSGVDFVMTIHCSDKAELLRRPQFRLLMSAGAVDWCVFLENVGEISEIISAKELENENCGAYGSGHMLRYDRAVHSLSDEYARADA